MSKEFPHHNFLAELLHDTISGFAYGETAPRNSRQLSFQGRCWNTSSKPSPQPPGHHVPPSIRPQTHPCTMRHVCGHSTQGFSRLWEEWHGGHTPCTTTADISFAPIPGYLENPVPSWRSTSMPTPISMNEGNVPRLSHRRRPPRHLYGGNGSHRVHPSSRRSLPSRRGGDGVRTSVRSNVDKLVMECRS